jgi:arylformamidase
LKGFLFLLLLTNSIFAFMQMSFIHAGKTYHYDSSKPIDISIPLREGDENVKAFYADDPVIEPMRTGGFVGDILEGGTCNVNTVFFNPHCNGTHTECVGHISREKESLNQCLKEFFFMARLVTVTPVAVNYSMIINNPAFLSKVDDELVHGGAGPEKFSAPALILRTTPNDATKLTRNYSGKNPPFLHFETALIIAEKGIDHLLIDLPSVDKEDDQYLEAHHCYWDYPRNPLYMDVSKVRTGATITELIYVPDSVPDGFYLLNLQITSLENDASPSKPVLYALSSEG